jgi:uncharacterized repeat protein (TIGR02543 family)
MLKFFKIFLVIICFSYLFGCAAKMSPNDEDSGDTIITLDADGGFLPKDRVWVFSGEKLDLPEPVREGYTFRGWFTAAGEAVEYAYENMTLYAKWEIKTLKVTFLSYNDEILDIQEVGFGQDAVAPAAPLRESNGDYSYTFYEWDVPFIFITHDLTVKAVYTEYYRGIAYKLKTGTYQVVGYDEKLTGISIPETYKNIPVTGIAEKAFDYCENLHNITLPNSLISIDQGAFRNCQNLEGINIPTSVQSIDSSAFENCTGLRSVIFEAGSRLQYIGNKAFSGCTSLVSITLPKGVNIQLDNAFSYCSSLVSINVDPLNLNYQAIDGNLYSKDGSQLLQYAPGKADEEYVMPYSVNEINMDAFTGSRYLKNIRLNDRFLVKDPRVFMGCDNLIGIMADEDNPRYQTTRGDLYSKDGSELIFYAYGQGLEHYEVQSGVKKIGAYAFYGCDTLLSVTIPEGVSEIGNYAFSRCKNLETVNLPDTLPTIGYKAFSGTKWEGLESFNG